MGLPSLLDRIADHKDLVGLIRMVSDAVDFQEVNAATRIQLND